MWKLIRYVFFNLLSKTALKPLSEIMANKKYLKEARFSLTMKTSIMANSKLWGNQPRQGYYKIRSIMYCQDVKDSKRGKPLCILTILAVQIERARKIQCEAVQIPPKSINHSLRPKSLAQEIQWPVQQQQEHTIIQQQEYFIQCSNTLMIPLQWEWRLMQLPRISLFMNHRQRRRRRCRQGK